MILLRTVNKKSRKQRLQDLKYLWSRRESNSYLEFRKLLFYPLNYGTNLMCKYADVQMCKLSMII